MEEDEEEVVLPVATYVHLIRTSLQTLPAASPEERFESLQYLGDRRLARPIRSKELFEALEKTFRLFVPYHVRRDVFSAVDKNGDGMVDFEGDFMAFLQVDHRVEEAKAVQTVCRGLSFNHVRLVDLFRGKEKVSVAEFVRVLQDKVVQGLTNEEIYPLLHGVGTSRDGFVYYDRFKKYLEPKFEELEANDALLNDASSSSSSSLSVKQTPKRPSTARPSGRTSSSLRQQKVVSKRKIGRSSEEESNFPLLGKIEEDSTLAILVDISPGMARSMKVGPFELTRLEFACAELDLFLQHKTRKTTSRFNIILFGDEMKLVKWENQSVSFSEDAVQRAKQFLQQQLAASRNRAPEPSVQSSEEEEEEVSTSTKGAAVFKCALKDIMENDNVSRIHVICSMEKESVVEFCALQTLDPGSVIKILSDHNPNKHQPSTPRRSNRLIQNGSQCMLHFGVIGSARDNSLDAIQKILTHNNNGNGRVLAHHHSWVDDNGILKTDLKRPTSAHPISLDDQSILLVERAATSAHQPGSRYWWINPCGGQEGSHSAAIAKKLRKAFTMICRTILKSAMTLDGTYKAFDANGDGVVSVSDFLSVFRPLLKKQSHIVTGKLKRRRKTNKSRSSTFRLTRIEEYQLWRCLDYDELGIVGLNTFCAFFLGVFQQLNLSIPEFTKESVKEKAMTKLNQFFEDELKSLGVQHESISRIAQHAAALKASTQNVFQGNHDGEEEIDHSNEEDDDEDDDMSWLPPPQPEEEDEQKEEEEESDDEYDEEEFELEHDDNNQQEEEEDVVMIPGLLPCAETWTVYGNGHNTVEAENYNGWAILCEKYYFGQQFGPKTDDALTYTLNMQKLSMGVSCAVYQAVDAGKMYLQSPSINTPGILRARVRDCSAQKGKMNLPEYISSSFLWKHKQPTHSHSGNAYATFHPLDMEEWLQASEFSYGMSEISCAMPILDPQDGVVFGSSDSKAFQWFDDGALMRSPQLRTVVRAKQLIGKFVSNLDRAAPLQRIIDVGLLPPGHGDSDTPRPAIILEDGQLIDLSDDTKQGQQSLRNVHILIDSDSHCCGSSDGEVYVPPGSYMPICRYWGPLKCHAVANMQANISFQHSPSPSRCKELLYRMVIEVPALMPFKHEVNKEKASLRLGPSFKKQDISWSDPQIASLKHESYEGVSVTTSLLDSDITLFQLDADSHKFVAPEVDHSSQSAKSLIMKLSAIRSTLVCLSNVSKSESVWMFEVPTEDIVHGQFEETLGMSWLLNACQAIHDVAMKQGRVKTPSGQVTLSFPVVSMDTGFVPIEGLHHTYMRSTLELNEQGCDVRSYCAGAWQMVTKDSVQHPPCHQGTEDGHQELPTWKDRTLSSEKVVISRPFVCFTVAKDVVTSTFLCGKDSWIRKQGGGANGSSALKLEVPYIEVPLAEHHRLRSPTKKFRAKPFTGKSTHLEIGHHPQKPKLYRIPDDATTPEVCFIVKRALDETMKSNQPVGADLSQLFDVFCEISKSNNGNQAKMMLHHSPRGKKKATSTKPVSLNRKGLEKGLRRVLGIKMPWAQFDALFTYISGGRENITKSRFVKLFGLKQSTSSKALNNKVSVLSMQEDGLWIREALYDIADVLEERGLEPYEVLSEGASVAEFVRFLNELEIGLNKAQTYQLMSAMDGGTHQKRRVVTNEDFGRMMSIVYEERLYDLHTLRHSTKPNTARSYNIDKQITHMERILRRQKLLEYTRFLFKMSKVDHEIAQDMKRVEKLEQQIANVESLVNNAVDDDTEDTLKNRLNELRESFATVSMELNQRVKRMQRRSLEKHQKYFSSVHDVHVLEEEMRNPWLHIPLLSSSRSRQDYYPHAFATLLKRARMNANTHDNQWTISEQSRYERLSFILKRMEKNAERVVGAAMMRSNTIAPPSTRSFLIPESETTNTKPEHPTFLVTFPERTPSPKDLNFEHEDVAEEEEEEVYSQDDEDEYEDEGNSYSDIEPQVDEEDYDDEQQEEESGDDFGNQENSSASFESFEEEEEEGETTSQS